VHSALSEVLDNVLPYDDVLALRDRMWELSPSLVRYGTLEHTSTDIALAGLQALVAHTASAKVSGSLFRNPIANFYQTDPISRAYVHLSPHTASETNHIRDGTSQVGDNGAMYACVCQG
jgi:NADH dehydrogenase (ubiquinone) Fe-S protein 1